MSNTSDRFAVIGMAGRFPGARDLDAFWRNLEAGQESVSRLEVDGEETARGVLEGAEYFDAEHFGYSPREAQLTDPQQRLLLQCAWQALEDAGHAPRHSSRDLSVGVFACSSDTEYARREHVEPAYWPTVGVGNDRDFLAPRLSYALDLRGPSVVVQTACSSALVAVHMACQSLLCGESDMTLVGAVSVTLPQVVCGPLLEGGIVAPDGRCRAFDAEARGTVRGYGLGVLVLRRLDDALAHGDHVRAVILGSAVNSDGAGKVGFSAPGVDGQAAVVAEALAVAGVAPGRVSYVEGHGSGTPLGDPVEVAALNRALAGHGGRCALGSVKTNIGHLDAAAGMAGIIKTILCLERGRLVPSLHFQRANPQIDFAGGPLRVQTRSEPWLTDGEPRVAGVSSFGMGGTNAHVVLAEAPPNAELGTRNSERRVGNSELGARNSERRAGNSELGTRNAEEGGLPWHLLVLSARTPTALEGAASRLAEHLRQRPDLDLADVAFTLQAGREQLEHRLALACRTTHGAAAALERRDPDRVHRGAREPGEGRPLCFMFSGLGDQRVGMGRQLYRHEPEFSRQVDRCAELLRPFLGRDLRELLYPPARAGDQRLRLFRRSEGGELDHPTLAHPALFVLGYALARAWMARGIRPRGMIGYSIGEYVAACVAGVFSLQDALHLVAVRARIMASAPPGAMVAVPAAAERVRALLGPGLHLSAQNGPALCVVSGEAAAVARLQERLLEQGLASMRPPGATVAFHSPLLNPCRDGLAELVASVPRAEPTIPFVSNLTGDWITAAQATDPGYWADHMTHPVLMDRGLETLCAEEPRGLLLELGPGQSLCSVATGILRRAGQGSRPVVASLPPDTEPGGFSAAMGRVWLAGCDLRLPLEEGQRVPLPTYGFEGRRFVLEGEGEGEGRRGGVREGKGRGRGLSPRGGVNGVAETPEEEALVACWERALGVRGVGVHDRFQDLGGHSLLAVQMLHDLRRASGIDLSPRDIMERPTIRQLAARVRNSELGARNAEPGAETDDGDVADSMVRILARALGLAEDELAPEEEIEQERLSVAVPHIVWAARRRWGLPLYPHEILARPSAAALAELVEEQLRAPEPAQGVRAGAGAGARAREDGEGTGAALDRDLEASAAVARRQCARLNRRNPPAVFILSAARSGSTLLRVMLAGHPALFCPPELHLLMHHSLARRRAALPSEHFGRGLRRALQELLDDDAEADRWLARLDEAPMAEVYAGLQRLAQESGMTLVDKSPSYAASVDTLCRAEEIFEAPRYVFLTRHPHAVMESYVRNRMAAMAGPDRAGRDPWVAAEHHWTTHNHNVLALLERVPDRRQARVAFEELVRRPRAVMERLCAFLRVPFHEATLDPYGGGRMTDGPGDPAFHERRGIDAGLADEAARPPRPLCAASKDVARLLGYDVGQRGSTQ